MLGTQKSRGHSSLFKVRASLVWVDPADLRCPPDLRDPGLPHGLAASQLFFKRWSPVTWETLRESPRAGWGGGRGQETGRSFLFSGCHSQCTLVPQPHSGNLGDKERTTPPPPLPSCRKCKVKSIEGFIRAISELVMEGRLVLLLLLSHWLHLGAQWRKGSQQVKRGLTEASVSGHGPLP